MGTKYAPRGEGEGASGWRRIGRYDLARRRALWARLILKAKVGDEICDADVLGIELCAGREGDDAHVKLGPGGMRSAWWTDLVDVMLRALEAANEDDWREVQGYVVRDGRSYLCGWSMDPTDEGTTGGILARGLGFRAEWSTSRDDALVVADKDQAELLARLTNAKVEPVDGAGETARKDGGP